MTHPSVRLSESRASSKVGFNQSKARFPCDAAMVGRRRYRSNGPRHDGHLGQAAPWSGIQLPHLRFQNRQRIFRVHSSLLAHEGVSNRDRATVAPGPWSKPKRFCALRRNFFPTLVLRPFRHKPSWAPALSFQGHQKPYPKCGAP